jgi:hypothetical protein
MEQILTAHLDTGSTSARGNSIACILSVQNLENWKTKSTPNKGRRKYVTNISRTSWKDFVFVRCVRVRNKNETVIVTMWFEAWA